MQMCANVSPKQRIVQNKQACDHRRKKFCNTGGKKSPQRSKENNSGERGRKHPNITLRNVSKPSFPTMSNKKMRQLWKKRAGSRKSNV